MAYFLVKISTVWLQSNFVLAVWKPENSSNHYIHCAFKTPTGVTRGAPEVVVIACTNRIGEPSVNSFLSAHLYFESSLSHVHELWVLLLASQYKARTSVTGYFVFPWNVVSPCTIYCVHLGYLISPSHSVYYVPHARCLYFDPPSTHEISYCLSCASSYLLYHDCKL